MTFQTARRRLGLMIIFVGSVLAATSSFTDMFLLILAGVVIAFCL